MLKDLSNEEIEKRLDMVEHLIHIEKDEKALPFLNNLFQELIDEQVRRELDD